MSEKLQKVLSRSGLASRRVAEEWIAAGRVAVNNKIATLGDRVEAHDDIRVDGKRVAHVAEEEMERRVIAYHKSEGEVVSRNDPEGRPGVFDQLPPLKGQRWLNIGRLDIGTSGLLLFTNDGALANRLVHPSTAIEREYAVRIIGELTAEKQKALLKGVMLEDGMSKFLTVADAGGQGANHWYRCSLIGGRFREVRRLWESQSLTISRLICIRFGSYAMPSTLRQGGWLELNGDEISRLELLCKIPAKKHTGLYGRARRIVVGRNRDNRNAGAGADSGGKSADRDIDPRPGKGGHLHSRR